MRIRLLVAVLVAFLLSFFITTGWFSLFGFKAGQSLSENLLAIFTYIQFWQAIGIWGVFFGLFFTVPIAVIITEKSKEAI